MKRSKQSKGPWPMRKGAWAIPGGADAGGLDHLVYTAGGDARAALNGLELAVLTRESGPDGIRCMIWPRWRSPCNSGPSSMTRMGRPIMIPSRPSSNPCGARIAGGCVLPGADEAGEIRGSLPGGSWFTAEDVGVPTRRSWWHGGGASGGTGGFAGGQDPRPRPIHCYCAVQASCVAFTRRPRMPQRKLVRSLPTCGMLPRVAAVNGGALPP